VFSETLVAVADKVAGAFSVKVLELQGAVTQLIEAVSVTSEKASMAKRDVAELREELSKREFTEVEKEEPRRAEKETASLAQSPGQPPAPSPPASLIMGDADVAYLGGLSCDERCVILERRRVANQQRSVGMPHVEATAERRSRRVQFAAEPEEERAHRVSLAPFDECRSLERAFLRKYTYGSGGSLTTIVPKKFARSLMCTRTMKETSKADFAAMTAEVLGARHAAFPGSVCDSDA
jgi:hypothetical protein